jgi:hypothetical protein
LRTIGAKIGDRIEKVVRVTTMRADGRRRHRPRN